MDKRAAKIHRHKLRRLARRRKLYWLKRNGCSESDGGKCPKGRFTTAPR
jgi:hypothetical protein